MFACCHPVLSHEARVALTLRVLGGLTTEEIARAFVLPSATIGQRVSRAKRTLADQVYLIFNEGYAATAGASRNSAGEAAPTGLG